MTAADAELGDEPERTALYHIYGDADLLLYIGISKDFGQRWKSEAKACSWWAEHRRMTVLWYDSRPEAKEAEEAAIKAEHPKHNDLHSVTRLGDWGRTEAIEQAVARKLKELRQLAGLPQVKIAERMFSRGQPWHQQTVYKVEAGQRPVRVGELADLAAIFGVTPATLLSDDDYGDAAAEREVMEHALREQIAAEILSGTERAAS